MSVATNRAAAAWRPVRGMMRPPALHYLVFAGVATAAMFPTLKTIFETWASSSAYRQGALAAPMALWMIAFSGRMRWPVPHKPAHAMGAAMLVAALALWLFGRAAGISLIDASAFVLVLLAGFMLVFGVGATRAAALPFAVLAFMAPFGETLSAPLQQATATAAHAGLNLAGIGAVRDGLIITTGNGSYRIAAACAGLGFVLTAVMTGLFVSWLAFNRIRSRVLFIAGALMLALIANWVRTIVVIGAATLGDNGADIANDHAGVGWWIYALVVGVLFVAAHTFRETPSDYAPSAPEVRAHASGLRRSALTAALGAVAFAGIYQAAVVAAPREATALKRVIALSAPAARGWTGTVSDIDPVPAFFSHADGLVDARYERQAHEVRVIAAYFERDRPHAEIAGERSKASIENLPDPPREWTIRYWLGDRMFSSRITYSMALGLARMLGRHPPGGILAINVVSGDPSLSEAFLADLEAMGSWRPQRQPSAGG